MPASTESMGVLKNCLRVMLTPVVRLSLRHSLHLGQLIEILKDVFVDCARRELVAQKELISLSKLSIMTGVHRKDVTRIMRAEEPKRREPHLIGRIMVQWQHHPDFITKAGKPRVLSVEGRLSEFAELVKSVNGENISAYSVMNEMQRLGAIEKKGATVKLLWSDFVTSVDDESGMRSLSDDINIFSLAVEENLFGKQELKNLHLKTEFDNIPPQYIPEIRSWLLEEGSQFHRRTRDFLCKFDRDTNPGLKESPGSARVAMGTFSLAIAD